MSSLDEARSVKGIGSIKDDVCEQYLLRRGFTNLKPTFGDDANTANLKKLMLGRIDLWVSSRSQASVSAREAGIPRESIEPVYTLLEVPLYIAFSKDTPDAAVAEWQRALNAIKKDGTYGKIMRKYPSGTRSMTFIPPPTAP